jgi:hypothetical protein
MVRLGNQCGASRIDNFLASAMINGDGVVTLCSTTTGVETGVAPDALAGRRRALC